MAILPFGLNPVSSNARTTLEPETLRSQLRFPPVDIPNDISLAGAKRAGAIAPKKFQWVIAFHPIRPSDGEFLADHSHVFHAQLHEFGPVLLFTNSSLGLLGRQAASELRCIDSFADQA